MGSHKPEERKEARRLRSTEGMPLKRIAARLGVSPASVHTWTKDIVLSEAERQRNLKGPGGPQNPEYIAKRIAAWKQAARQKRRDAQDSGRAKARELDPLHLAGCMLYWAEGAKQRNVMKLCNSDPHMVSFFARFLRESLRVSNDRLRCSLNVYTNNGLAIEEIEAHWLEMLQLQRSCLRGHQLNHYPTSSSGRHRRLPYGVCTLSVARSTYELQHVYGAIQEYGRFDEPRWLDGPPRKEPESPDAAQAVESSTSSSAFCACRRFSAWSHTAERSP